MLSSVTFRLLKWEKKSEFGGVAESKFGFKGVLSIFLTSVYMHLYNNIIIYVKNTGG
jgi:hypothetical protein